MSDIKHWWLYVLKLEGGKWYVGITSKTPEQRFSSHQMGDGSYWTKKYRPVKIHYSQDLGICEKNRAEAFEDKATREYMKKYGINNVRGGYLTDMDEYSKPFGRLLLKDDWLAVKIMAFELFVIAFLLFSLLSKK